MSGFPPITRHGLDADQLDDLAVCANLLTRFKEKIAAVLDESEFAEAEGGTYGAAALEQTRRAIDWLLLERPE
jgi:hypothetical protein